MKLIIGLGNPGERYKANRHNVGHMAVGALAIKLLSYDATKLRYITSLMRYKAMQPKWQEVSRLDSSLITIDSSLILAKPQTFMNVSGGAVKKLVNWFKVSPDSLYVIHDDLDISLGQYKIQKGKGPKLHYGVQSINEALGTRQYWRVRIGVDNRGPNNRTPGEQYVLQDFTSEEEKVIDNVIPKIIKELTCLPTGRHN